jgi:hypothetical protein
LRKEELTMNDIKRTGNVILGEREIGTNDGEEVEE